jgi:hypothetical protein
MAGRIPLLFLCVLLSATSAGTAYANGVPPASAIAQYVETLPTGSGGQAVGVGEAITTKLTPRILRKIRKTAGPAAPTLIQAATSSAYGAPAISQPRATAPVGVAPVRRPHPWTPPRPKPQLSAAAGGEPVPPASLARALSVVVPTSWSTRTLAAWLGLAITSAIVLVLARRTNPAAAPKRTKPFKEN